MALDWLCSNQASCIADPLSLYCSKQGSTNLTVNVQKFRNIATIGLSLPTRQSPYRVHGASNHSPKRVPGPVIKPVPHVEEALLAQVLRHTVVEIRIELVNYALVLDHRKQPEAESHYAYTEQGRCFGHLSRSRAAGLIGTGAERQLRSAECLLGCRRF